MTYPIEAVPALKRVDLLNVGCWQELSMEFLPGLNLIAKEGPAWGRTTILQAILQALVPQPPARQQVSPTRGFPRGRITLEFLHPSRSVDLLPAPDPAPEPASGPGPGETAGTFALNRLREALSQAGPDTCLLIEDDATSVLDERDYREAVRLLNSARCQVISLIRRRLDPADFPRARVFLCSSENDKARMRLARAGGKPTGGPR